MKKQQSIAVLVLLGILSISALGDDRKLKLREDGTFTIMQLTDIHYGESDIWDNQNDLTISKLIESE